MNRPYSPRHRYQNGFVLGSGSFVGAIVVLIIVLLVALRLFAPGIWHSVTAPLWRAGNALSSRIGGIGTNESKAALTAERDTYAAQAAALANQNAALSAKVADLTKLLGTRTEPAPGIVAAVLARPPVAPYDVLIIDQGTSAGVVLGALVTGNGGTPIGTIGEADTSQSRVTLFSTHGIQTSGWAGDSRIPVTLVGAGAGAFTASVPNNAGVKVGDGVYIASGGAYPVGTVVKIETDPSSPTVNLDIRPYANPFSLVWVTVAQ